MIPQFKVNVGGVNYEGELFTDMIIKRRENNYDTAVLHCDNAEGATYGGLIDVFDELRIFLKKTESDSYTEVFRGRVRQLNPFRTADGDMMEVKCKSQGAALEATHCKRDYGTESSNPTLDTCKEIWEDIIINFVNKSLGSASYTGYSLGINAANFASATPISYMNNPFRACKDTIDLLCDIATAIADGAAGPHWFVDVTNYLYINTIGNHEDAGNWPNWVNGTEALSDLTNYAFLTFNTVDSSDEYANKIILITDIRKPVYDLWTQATTGWGSSGLAAFATDTGLIGNSLKFTQNGTNTGYIYYPSAQNAAWNITKWGTKRTIPTITFYFKKDVNWDAGETASTGNLLFYTSAGNYLYPVGGAPIFSINDPVGEWVTKKIPIGPYAANPQWAAAGAGVWTNINWVQFNVASVLGTGNGIGWIDDLHFTGQIARCAYDSGEITANKEYQKIFISRYALDDSCVATNDSGTAARLAYAQLLRRKALPYSIVFSVPLEPTWMAGQKLKINTIPFRATEIQHNFSLAGATTQVSATSDLLNSHPISVTDQHSLIMENIMVVSKDAKDIRASSEVDSLLDLLEVNYA